MVSPMLSIQDTLPGLLPTPPESSNGHGLQGQFVRLDYAFYDRYATQLGPYGLAVYIALARHAYRKTSRCHVKVQTLAHELAMSERQVRYALKHCEWLGLIRRTPRYGEGRRGQVESEYTVLHPWQQDPPATASPAYGAGPGAAYGAGPGAAYGAGRTRSQKEREVSEREREQGANLRLAPLTAERDIATKEEDQTSTSDPLHGPAPDPDDWDSPTPEGHAQELVEGWNGICDEYNELPPKQRITKVLEAKILARLQTYPEHAFWQIVLDKLATEPHFHGQNRDGWKASLDWLVKNDEHPLQVYEGIYDRPKRRRRPHGL